MPGRKTFTAEEIAAGRALLDRSMAAWRGLAAAARVDGAGSAAQSAGEMEPFAAQALLLALDRFYVHRGAAGTGTGTGTTPLDELGLVADSVISGTGRFDAGTVATYDAGRSVLGLRPGAPVVLHMDDVERLVGAALAELQEGVAVVPA